MRRAVIATAVLSLFAFPLLAWRQADAQTAATPPATRAEPPFGPQAAPYVFQGPPPPTRPGYVTIVPANTAGCPLAMRAQRRGPGQTVWTVALEDTARPGVAPRSRQGNSGVHVELAWHASVVRGVTLEVFYRAPGPRFEPVADQGTADDRAGDLAKTFSLSADDESGNQLAADLLVGPSGGVTRVHLLSVRYADGHEWHATSDTHCSVEPNGFMRVGAVAR